MNEVHRTLRIFLSSSCLIAAVATTATSASADDTTTSSKQRMILQGGASDAEKLQKSVKLMVPDPTAAAAPQYRQPQMSPSDIMRQSAQMQEFRARAEANRAAALQRQQEAAAAAAANAAHQAMIERHFGIETVTNVSPTQSYLMPARGARQILFPQGGYVNVRRDLNTQPQIDPWTDVNAVPFRQKKLAELQATIKQLHLNPPPVTQTAVATGQIQPSAAVAAATIPQIPLKAVEMMLPMAPPPKDWDAWYKRVASSIYDRWKQNTAGPGTAVVLITVYASRDVDCRVTNFTEADGAARNGDEESRFKQISLQCVDGLNGDEIWQFPAVTPLPKKIVFDMEFKHIVGEDAGCRIVHLHNQLPETSQR